MAEKYGRIKNRHRWSTGFLQLLFWVLFFYFSLELKLYQAVEGLFYNRELIFGLYILLITLIYFSYSTIFSYVFHYRRERRFDLSSQTSGAWLVDTVKSFVLNFVILLLMSRFLFYLINYRPDFWWLYWAAGVSLFTVLLTFILPKILLPFFFELTEYPSGELRDRLMAFINRLDINVEEIYEINLSSKINYANAAVVGLGQTRRILLGDNLSEKYTPAEIEAVLAHELAHHVHGDVIKNILLEPFIFTLCSGAVFFFWPYVGSLFSYSDPALYTLPLLMIFWGLIYGLFQPLQLYLSRKYERRADRFACEKIEEPRNFASALARLADESLQRLDYSWYQLLFSASHPPPGERVRQALDKNKTSK